jgi:ABC-type multidrug transport system ATPase subunit/ABC-type multidrug transport system permease subunit
MSESDVVTVRGLRKAYGDRVVVDGLDLDVPAGEIVGLIGANGAGKTTTVECIQGLRQPDGGSMRVLGLDPVRQSDRLRPLLGGQLQDSALPDRMRVGEAIDLFATDRAGDAGELLTRFGLEQRRRSAFAGLSGGERQRLFLVLALLNRPRLVILDELTQGLDPAARRDVWAAVAQLRDAGTTVLLVTHEIDEAEALCDTVVAMRGGRPRHVTARPSRSVVRRLIRAELRLIARDPLTLTFVFAFPIVTMLIIGGAFGTTPDPAFDGVNPSHWYVASYFTVVIAATGLVMLPVHMAAYRERGVLRRFAAAGFPRWSFALAELVIGLAMIVLAAMLLLAVAAPVYGIPPVEHWWRVVVGFASGAVGFVSLGVLLGSLLPSARSAQAVGLLLFFPSFLLGAGGPPPHVMGSALRQVADVLPLTLVTNSIREPWLGIGNATGAMVEVIALSIAACVVAARRAAL